MTPTLLQPAGHLAPADALALAQQAPAVLQSFAAGPSPTAPLLQRLLCASAESPEAWVTYENLLLSCLRTGDTASAHACIRRLAIRFGSDNDRVRALQGVVREAEASVAELPAVLQSYDDILAHDDVNVPVHKRRAALLRSMGRPADAVNALLALLAFSPTDAEAWAELSDVYRDQGLYAQALHALDEVLVLAPNAWNIHARVGETAYMAASAGAGTTDAATQKYAAEALKRFCRSIELCDDYLRGYYGLKITTSYILKHGSKWPKQTPGDDLAVPDTAKVQRLEQLATAKLADIVRRYTAKETHWSGYDEAEIAAARDLLASTAAPVVR